MNKTIKIEGMMCDGCANKVKEVFSEIENIKQVNVNLPNKEVEIIADANISNETLQLALEDADTNYEIID